MLFETQDKVLDQLEFDKILSILADSCKGQGGRSLIQGMEFVLEVKEIEKMLGITSEIVLMMEISEAPSLSEYEAISEDMTMLSKQNYVLDQDAFARILNVLLNYDLLDEYYTEERTSEYPNSYHHLKVEDYSSEPLKSIQKVFDEKKAIRQNASPQLAKLFKKSESVKRQLDRVFNDILRSYKANNTLADSPESWRNGRRVLVLPIEKKGKIPGVIHDHSASGKTVFVEPSEVMQINNELFSIDNAKRAEIFKILRVLSEELRSHRHLIMNIYDRVARLDVALAKARLSRSLGGVQPKIVDHPTLKLLKARHPLLLLHNKKHGLNTISFDLELHGDNRVLLISGPNAGGKSVTLKAVGLIHLLVYSGILVPVGPECEVGIFRSIFTDIGDHQSIDEGLSTYSSHLGNLRDILKKVDEYGLVLCDELGSGTDPKLGGAIAEGIIKELLKRKSYGIITTHYSSLKVFAFREKGIVNGAMLFDKEHLQPTYRLKVGKPGSSYAFEVAKKVGLDQAVVRYARKKAGSKSTQVEDYLINLQEGKANLDEKLEEVEKEQKRLDRLIANYEQLNREFQVKRKKLQIRSKEIEVKNANDKNLELQELINKLEAEKSLEKARKLKAEAIEKRKKESEEIISLKREILESKDKKEIIKVGQYVRMIDGDLSGEVLKIKGEIAEVLFGLMKMKVPLADLTRTKPQLDVNQQKSINIKGVALTNNFSPKLDIRGYKLDDADRTLDVFFDKALLNNVRTLEVVHGKGSGVLRKLVKKKMKEYKDIHSYYHPEDEFGGDGVTVIRM